MDDLERLLVGARKHLEPQWGEEEVARLGASVAARARRRGRRLRLGIGALAGACLAIFAVAGMRGSGPGHRDPIAGRASTYAVRFTDGSVASLQGTASLLRVIAESADRIEVEVAEGRCDFDVRHVPGRQFRVHAGAVVVRVVGTQFTVERAATGTVRVRVERGRVVVQRTGRGEVELGAGDEARFDATPVAAAGASEAAAAVPNMGQPAMGDGGNASAGGDGAAGGPASPPEDAHASGHSALVANRAEGLRSPGAPVAAPPAEEADPVEALLIAADAAQARGAPLEALSPLGTILERYPGDPRAPLAALTMGRILLANTDRAREAAELFARVRELDPSGALAEDALAREIEAWVRAGRQDIARQHAIEYRDSYPNGHRARAVRNLSGLEDLLAPRP